MRGRDDNHMLSDLDADGRDPSDGRARFRPPSHIRAIALIALACAVLGIGGIRGASHASQVRSSLAGECSAQTERMNSAAASLRRDIETANETTDASMLQAGSDLAARWRSATLVQSAPQISCETSLRNKDLESNTTLAQQWTQRYQEQAGDLKTLRAEIDKTAARTSANAARERLSQALRSARSMLERTEGTELKVPYLRTRLNQLADEGQRALDDTATDTDRLEACAMSLESMTGQVGESAGLQ